MLNEFRNMLDSSKGKKPSVSAIKEFGDKIDFCDYEEFAKLLEDDERKSVADYINKLFRKKERHEKEINRLYKINEFENTARANGYTYIGGVDEAGRGPLAGPVIAAVVVFKGETLIEGINDSKQLSEAKREELFEIIKEEAFDFGIGMADSREIDEHNILNATYIAMKRAIANLKKAPDYLLNDAVIIPGIDIPQKSIIKGDSKSITIAAASILAKVTRDRLMYEYDKEFPGYGFVSNKGYGTSVHYDGIRNKGITPIHRLSFLKNFNF